MATEQALQRRRWVKPAVGASIALMGLVVCWGVFREDLASIERDPELHLAWVRDVGGAGSQVEEIAWSPDLDGDGAAELVLFGRRESGVNWRRLWRTWTIEPASVRQSVIWVGSARGELLHMTSAEYAQPIDFVRGEDGLSCVHMELADGRSECLAPHVCVNHEALQAPDLGPSAFGMELPYRRVARVGGRSLRLHGREGETRVVDEATETTVARLPFPKGGMPRLVGSPGLAARGIALAFSDPVGGSGDDVEDFVLYEIAPDRAPALRRWGWRMEELPFSSLIAASAAYLGADGQPRLLLRASRPANVQSGLFEIEITREGRAVVHDLFRADALIGESWAGFFQLGTGLLALDAGFAREAPHGLILHVATASAPLHAQRLPYTLADFGIRRAELGSAVRSGERPGVHHLSVRSVPDRDGDGEADACFALEVIGGGWRSTIVRGFLSGATGKILLRSPATESHG